ncbi:hypothetical protein JCM19239_5351 [Vibrio variabilis]|uniref:Uncharacterized protein n=1 Tax=Vibrio variabilis TaxID=990271 RepID=A0ABQ0JCQ0_9VIBR|nr:hypothetical protein JCM19239_5351 [Vibrio variabilis]
MKPYQQQDTMISVQVVLDMIADILEETEPSVVNKEMAESLQKSREQNKKCVGQTKKIGISEDS